MLTQTLIIQTRTHDITIKDAVSFKVIGGALFIYKMRQQTMAISPDQWLGVKTDGFEVDSISPR